MVCVIVFLILAETCNSDCSILVVLAIGRRMFSSRLVRIWLNSAIFGFSERALDKASIDIAL